MAIDPPIQAILAAAGSFFLVTLIFATIYVVCKATKQQPNRQSRARARNRTRPISGPDLSVISVGESATFDPTLNRVSMSELLQSTRNFAPDLIIGDGSFGLVYKAKLANGVTVAVKKLGDDAFQGFREFRAEMETLGKIRHRNIVKILGYYATGLDRVLIYEFIEKGSLDQWLYDTSSDNNDVAVWLPLPWKTRVNIVKGVAAGLCYMHNLVTPIIHRDIKASNILLDLNFEAHIADFGLARRIDGTQSHVSTQVAGTMGYMPPEYIHGATMATMMGDIYSFGVLMLEIITGKRPNWPFKEEDGKEIGLVECAGKRVAENRQMEMVDANLTRDGLQEEGVVEFIRIATLCTSEMPKYRPAMKEVVELLNGISI
ncbi:hypothetical protein RJ639_000605 [Escallonia herrerae]|uniref:Protein kinase domain-containing protein n=1 Tax=Escallonia herrerae TaxID=1293975 RepID=A0AA89BU78_9ASTE|nr:hypothetical protein RJ639_000605 [Escallonia herrerae]